MKTILLIQLFICAALSYGATDPLFERQWGLENTGQVINVSNGEFTRDKLVGEKNLDINWIGSKLKKTKKNQVIVAVIDSGLDISHPELAGRVWENPSCANKNEEERKTLPCNGWNFLDGNNNLTDEIGHGTHVAGIIAANSDGRGIVGVTPKQVVIMPIKAINPNVNGFVYRKRIITDIIADSITFAVNNGADVINLSLGWPNLVHGKNIKKAIQNAIAKNVPVVAASGNNNKLLPVYPCSEPGVICVGAVDNLGDIVEFSNYGGKVDLLAPGQSIVGTYPQNKESRVLRIKGYESKNGSSQAAPFVTGTIAVMKLVNGDLTSAQVKARLYNSARELKQKNHKYSKFGLLNMKRAVNEEVRNFVVPDYKSLQVVNVFGGRFYFKLPIKNLGLDTENIEVKATLRDGKKIIFDDTQKLINLMPERSKNLTLSGKVPSLQISADLVLTIEINGEKIVHKSQYQLAFARDLIKDNALTNTSKIQNPNDFFAKITQRKRALYMRAMGGREKSSNKDEYYKYAKNKLFMVDGLTGHISTIPLNDIYKLISVFKVDVNLDGNVDFFTYSISKNKKNIYFDYFNSDGSKLFGERSRFVFPITEFEGPPIKNGDENFQYIIVNNVDLGKIRVPLIKKAWTLPKQDNNNDLFDTLPNRMKIRPYYLNPIIKGNSVTVEIRTLESFNFISKIKKELNTQFDTEIGLEDVYEQTELDYRSGRVNTLLSVGNEFNKEFFTVSFRTPKEYTLTKIDNGITFLEGNKTLKLGGKRPIYAHTTLIKKNHIRVAFEQDFSITDITWKTKSWNDPVFDILGGFNSGKTQHLFIETRYWINHLEITDGNITESRLPLNRDSSFPGVGFSETMKIFTGEIKGVDRVGVLVDSSLIYGNRIYAMISSDEGLKRPLALSFRIPKNCINLGIKRLKGKTQNAMVCLGNNKQLQFSYFDLAEN
ncbi:MAG: S8 family serine peptidase [Bacteriovoracaceae bacterium]|nr:S8 family serine peptidase [Bacteriovoracaceae bacterium]